MNSGKEIGRRLGAFIDEVGAELRKTTWPERRELMVVTFIVLLSVVVLMCDQVIQLVLKRMA